MTALMDLGARRVVHLGCGEDAHMQRLTIEPHFTKIIGTDVSAKALNRAEDRLRMDELGDRHRERVRLIQSSVSYADDRIAGLDAPVLMEVIEHIEPERVSAVVANVFGHARPGAVIVATPNAEYNRLYPSPPPGTMRHADRPFEWGRLEFQEWGESVSASHGYDVEFRTVGAVDPTAGPPTQLALFRRN